jgi:hypothetical protein
VQVRPAVLAWALASFVAPGSASAQRPGQPPITIDSLARGERIRIWSSQPTLAGDELEFRRADSRAVVVVVKSRLDSLAGLGPEIPRANITRIDVARGRRTSASYRIGTITGGVIGGALIGALGGAVLNAGGSGSDGMAPVILAPLGALGGGLVGVRIGAHGRPDWKPILLSGR